MPRLPRRGAATEVLSSELQRIVDRRDGPPFRRATSAPGTLSTLHAVQTRSRSVVVVRLGGTAGRAGLRAEARETESCNSRADRRSRRTSRCAPGFAQRVPWRRLSTRDVRATAGAVRVRVLLGWCGTSPGAEGECEGGLRGILDSSTMEPETPSDRRARTHVDEPVSLFQREGSVSGAVVDEAESLSCDGEWRGDSPGMSEVSQRVSESWATELFDANACQKVDLPRATNEPALGQ